MVIRQPAASRSDENIEDLEDLPEERHHARETMERNEEQVEAIKLYVKKCSAWNAERMNLLSISLLLVCGSIDSIGKLWVNFLCLNFGQLENLSSLTIAAIIFLLSLPLFLDTSFLLLQRVHPKELS